MHPYKIRFMLRPPVFLLRMADFHAPHTHVFYVKKTDFGRNSAIELNSY